MDKLIIQVALESRFSKFYAVVEVPPVFKAAFKSLHITDDPLIARCSFDEILPKDQMHERILTIRKDAAEHLAKEITYHLLKAMENEDTINGYRIVKEE